MKPSDSDGLLAPRNAPGKMLIQRALDAYNSACSQAGIEPRPVDTRRSTVRRMRIVDHASFMSKWAEGRSVDRFPPCSSGASPDVADQSQNARPRAACRRGRDDLSARSERDGLGSERR